MVTAWVSDVPGVFDADYVWHDLAQQWQTPDVGDTAVAELAAMSTADRADFLTGAGMATAVASRVSEGIDDVMGQSILTLYRSAAQPFAATAGQNLEAASARPGLALLPTEDHFVGTDEQKRRAAARSGARVEVLDGLGHWWMTETRQPLPGFWSTSGRSTDDPWGSFEPLLALALHLIEGHATVGSVLAGKAQDALGDDVARDLGGTAAE